MANKIQPIKFLNWLFLRIKPSEYDPSKPLTDAQATNVKVAWVAFGKRSV